MTPTRIPEALALLRERGWCQGGYVDETGARCIEGALLKVAEHNIDTIADSPYKEDRVAIAGVIRDELYPDEGFFSTKRVSKFNDHPATTFADVERVLEKAALARGGAL